jgi:hypothetical protein
VVLNNQEEDVQDFTNLARTEKYAIEKLKNAFLNNQEGDVLKKPDLLLEEHHHL